MNKICLQTEFKQIPFLPLSLSQSISAFLLCNLYICRPHHNENPAANISCKHDTRRHSTSLWIHNTPLNSPPSDNSVRVNPLGQKPAAQCERKKSIFINCQLVPLPTTTVCDRFTQLNCLLFHSWGGIAVFNDSEARRGETSDFCFGGKSHVAQGLDGRDAVNWQKQCHRLTLLQKVLHLLWGQPCLPETERNNNTVLRSSSSRVLDIS